MECFRFQISSEIFDSEPKKFNFVMIVEYGRNRESTCRIVKVELFQVRIEQSERGSENENNQMKMKTFD